MKTKQTRLVRNLAFGILILALLAAWPVAAQDSEDDDDRGNRRLVGTWIGQATITNCETGDVLQNFSRLTSFDRSGNVLETSTGLTPAQRTPALGVWEHARRNSYEYGLRFFRFDVAGNYIGYTRAEWSVTVRKSGNSYHATALIDVFLPNGVVVAHLCGTEDATRFETND